MATPSIGLLLDNFSTGTMLGKWSSETRHMVARKVTFCEQSACRDGTSKQNIVPPFKVFSERSC